jgi:hypothetical protein
MFVHFRLRPKDQSITVNQWQQQADDDVKDTIVPALNFCKHGFDVSMRLEQRRNDHGKWQSAKQGRPAPNLRFISVHLLNR